MFERLTELQERRTKLHQALAEVDAEIRLQFAEADQRINELRSAMGVMPTKRVGRYRRGADNQAASESARQHASAAMKAAWARKRANGEPWSGHHKQHRLAQ
jgi:DNA-binding protein H-NS